MRPRFSIKWLLIAFTLLGVAFYLCFARPTAIARQFLAFIHKSDFEGAQSLCVKGSERVLLLGAKGADFVVQSEVAPRTWTELCKMERLLIVRLMRTEGDPSSMDCHPGLQVIGVAGIFGVRLSTPTSVMMSPEFAQQAIADREQRLAQ